MKWDCGIPGKDGVCRSVFIGWVLSIKISVFIPQLIRFFLLLLLRFKSDWHGGLYRLFMFFTDDYPNKPPKCILYIYIYFFYYMALFRSICSCAFSSKYIRLERFVFGNLLFSFYVFNKVFLCFYLSQVCLSILSEEKDWKPAITVKQV